MTGDVGIGPGDRIEAYWIQAASGLGDKGHDVHMVEEETSTGGRMALPDGVFHTNGHSICILAPEMFTCSNRPSIDVLTCYDMEETKEKVERSG